MPQDSILKNVMTFVSMTALPLALCTSFAEARGVGVGHESRVQDVRSVGRATNAPKVSRKWRSKRTTRSSPSVHRSRC
jgi:hypothetical protein